MKKTLSYILAILVIFITAAGCGKEDNTVIRVGALKGPTSLGMLEMMDRGGEKYEFTVAGSADELTPRFIKGELDILSVPVNLGAVLYGKTEGNVKMLAVNTLGVVSIVENGNEVKDIKSLKGKTVYATGKGSVPEYAFKYILKNSGIDPEKDISIEWKSEPAEIVAMMTAGQSVIAMMPQPYITAAKSKVENFKVAVDLTEEWDKMNIDSRFITAGLFVRSEFAEKHPDAVERFMDEYKASAEYANSDTDGTAALSEKYGIINAAIAKKAIPECNIVCLTGEEMKTAASGFLRMMYEFNPKSVGGVLPDEEFFYQKK